MKTVNAHAWWWPCACLNCVSGLRKLEKTINFLRCIHVINLVLEFGSDINEGNLIQHLFYFIVFMGIVVSVIGTSFSAVFQILDWTFLVLHFDGIVCNWIPKMIWPRMDWFWRFLWENGFFRWFLVCMDWNLQELLTYCFFYYINFFRCLGWEVFWSVL